MKIDDKVDAVFIPDSPSRIKASDYNQIKNEIQECIVLAGLTPAKDVIQLPSALKTLTEQSGAEEMAKIEAEGNAQIAAVNTAGNAQINAVTSAGQDNINNINTTGASYVQAAKDWANKTDGPVADGEYSAKKYAQDAQESAKRASKLPIGSVYLSQSGLAVDNVGALPLFTGETIASASTLYPDFYAWLQNHSGLTCTAAEYEAALSTYGECPKYVLADGNLRLPLL
ncbi:MAG: hypothetical protein PUC11_02500, partial [Elusimicrobia bacterium]|nr:hypothetical protein [Elusimicrobiota bacterium]